MSVFTRECRSPLECCSDQPVPPLCRWVVKVLRARHFSCRTEEAYVHWIRHFILE
jgi:hypothetical protein